MSPLTGNNIDALLACMSRRRNFYILGAGTSYGLVPTTRLLRDGVARMYRGIGVFPDENQSKTPLFQRVIAPYKRYDFEESLLGTLSYQMLQALAQKLLYVPSVKPIPSQYAVFEVVPSPATIFNFNLDGLASVYLKNRHIVLTPHGTIDRDLVSNPIYKELLKDIAWGIEIPLSNPDVFIEPEPQSITNSLPYQHAMKLFPTSSAVILIGYSFARFHYSRDDFESFEFFSDLLRRYPKPTFIVDPFPDEVSELLSERTKSRSILPIPAKWEPLASAIHASVRKSGCHQIFCGKLCINRVLEMYHRFKN